jgi:hypothetical protein
MRACMHDAILTRTGVHVDLPVHAADGHQPGHHGKILVEGQVGHWTLRSVEQR